MLMITSQGFAIDSMKNDARLDLKVTLSLGLTTLDQFAKEISQQTGVIITAGNNKNDWRVKERKMVVFAKDIPAKELLSKIATLHHYIISGTGEGDKRTYRYWQDLKSRKEEKELQEYGEVDLAKKCAKAINYMADLCNSTDMMTPDQLAKLEKDDPYKHFLLTNPVGKALCNFASQLPANVWNSPGDWNKPIESFSPNLLAAANNMIPEWRKIYSIGREASEEENSADSISFKPCKDLTDGSFLQLMGAYGYIIIGTRGGIDVEIPLVRPEGIYGKLIADNAKEDSLNPGRNEGGGVIIKDDDLDKILKDDPVFKEKVKIKGKNDYVSLLQILHEKTGLSVLGDYYGEEKSKLTQNEAEIGEILVTIKYSLNKDISQENHLLTLSDKLWYEKREADISNSYLASLRKKAETVGLDLEDCKRIAADLNDKQIKKNLLMDESFKNLSRYLSYDGYREALRFFAFLTKDQILAMSGDSQLPVEHLQFDVLKHALFAADIDIESIRWKNATLSGYKISHSDKGLPISIRTILQIHDEQGNIESSLTIYASGPEPKPVVKPKN